MARLEQQYDWRVVDNKGHEFLSFTFSVDKPLNNSKISTSEEFTTLEMDVYRIHFCALNMIKCLYFWTVSKKGICRHSYVNKHLL